jgi:DNA-binding response OmpR family regulator
MPYKVVVVETSPSTRRAVEQALSAPEFEVTFFGDGLEAIEALRGGHPDAILTALVLASKDGYDVASFVRGQETGKDVALFFLRGALESLDMRRIAEVSHDGIVQKPFDSESLAGLVRRMIDRKKELPSIPEEAVLTRSLEPENPPDVVLPAAPSPVADDALEAKVRAIVREEFLNSREHLERLAGEVVAAEVKKVLVEELTRIDTRKL